MSVVPRKVCTAGTPCLQREEQAPPCGQSPLHLPPRRLAETLCQDAILGAIRAESNVRTNEKMPVGSPHSARAKSFRLGSLYLNLALQTASIQVSESARHFALAEEHLYDATREKCDDVVRLQSSLLRLYMPSFRECRNPTPPAANELQQIREGLLDEIDRADQAPRQYGQHELLGALLLCAAQGYNAFPANAREMGIGFLESRLGTHRYAHNLYALRPLAGNDPSTGIKAGYQLYTDPGGLKNRVIPLSFDRLASMAVRGAFPGEPESKPHSQTALDLLYEHGAAPDEPLDGPNSQMMQIMTDYLHVRTEKCVARAETARLATAAELRTDHNIASRSIIGYK